MTKTPILATAFAVVALPAAAIYASAPACAGGTPVGISGQTVCLTAEAAAHVASLQTHGDRYEATIRLIAAEAAKPNWTWAEEG